MPSAEELPSDISAIAKINAVELSNKRWRSDVGTLSAIAQRYDRWWSRGLTRLRAAQRFAPLSSRSASAAIIAAAIIASGGVFDGSSGGKTAAEQVDGIRATMQEEGFKVEYREVQLHQGAPSHLFIASNLDAQGAKA